MEMKNVKELKTMILEKISEEELNAKYKALSDKNSLFLKNKQMAYHIIATEVGAVVNIATTSRIKGAFPLKINEVQDSEKTNFDISGYVVNELRPFTNSSGNLMMYLTVADDTGIITVTVWSEPLETMLDKDYYGKFVKLSNLYWQDKTKFNPNFSKNSGIQEVEPTFDLKDIKTNTTQQVTEGGWFTIKGIVGALDNANKYHVLHCESGHRFKNLSDEDVGSNSLCEKCEDVTEVMKHVSVSSFILADEEGQIEASISTFAKVDDINIMDEFVFKGKMDDGVFQVMSALPVTEKKSVN